MDIDPRTSIKETEREFFNHQAEQAATKYKNWREIFPQKGRGTTPAALASAQLAFL